MPKKYDDSCAYIERKEDGPFVSAYLEISTKEANKTVREINTAALNERLCGLCHEACRKLHSYGYEIDPKQLQENQPELSTSAPDVDYTKFPEIDINEEPDAHHALEALYYTLKAIYWASRDDTINACLSCIKACDHELAAGLPAISENSKNGAKQRKSGKSKGKHAKPTESLSPLTIYNEIQSIMHKNDTSWSRSSQLLIDRYIQRYGKKEAENKLGSLKHETIRRIQKKLG